MTENPNPSPVPSPSSPPALPALPAVGRRTLLQLAGISAVGWLVGACRAATGLPPATGAPATAESSAGAATTAGGLSSGSAGSAAAGVTAAAPAVALAPTPACGDDDEPTEAQTEGPYFTPNSPERTSLREPGMAGTPLVVSGTVLTTGCQPVANALLDFWHADDAGAYDNVGYRLRGHQYTDEAGRYHLETIVPALYTGRTRHIHVKVQPPNQPVLTTQLYFPGEPANASDGIYDPDLEMAMSGSADGRAGTFDFVVVAG
jgi:protocatechuate 3,4-dioxygenase beta subunit